MTGRAGPSPRRGRGDRSPSRGASRAPERESKNGPTGSRAPRGRARATARGAATAAKGGTRAQRAPVAGLSAYDNAMGFAIESAGPGAAVMSTEVGPEVHNPTGVVHGGVVAGLADAAMGLALCLACKPGETAANLDLSLRFLRPTVAGRLRATARVVRMGRRVVQMACDVTDAGGALVATASSAFLRWHLDGADAPPAT